MGLSVKILYDFVKLLVILRNYAAVKTFSVQNRQFTCPNINSFLQNIAAARKNADFTVINKNYDVILTVRDGKIIFEA